MLLPADKPQVELVVSFSRPRAEHWKIRHSFWHKEIPRRQSSSRIFMFNIIMKSKFQKRVDAVMNYCNSVAKLRSNLKQL